MTLPTTYQIGTTYANMVNVKSLSSRPNDCEPRGDPMDYAEYIELGNGTRKGMGWLRQTWHFDYMGEAYRNALAAYAGSVYVYTRTNAGTFSYYTATLTWPDAEPEHYSNRVLDVTVELRNLVPYTPPG